jgi:uncharacterized protein (TIGR03437 family)
MRDAMIFRAVLLLLASLSPSALAQSVITTIAGSDWLFPGNGQPALKAPLGGNGLGLDVTTDHNGNYYICDGDNLMVMRVGPDGIINVIAGNGINFTSGDGGLAVNAGLTQPTAIAVDSSGSVYIGDYDGHIRKVTQDGIIHTIAGNGTSGFGGDNGPATAAMLYDPSGLAVDTAGNIFIADTLNNRIRKITPDGIIRTIAGNGKAGSLGDNGPATSAQLNYPTRIALDPAGNLYVVEVLGQRVRKVDVHGIITTFAGGGLDQREGIPATNAPIVPLAVAADSGGNVYIIDNLTAGIRKVNAQGLINTIAGGSGVAGFSGDGGPASAAVFHFFFHPALSVDPSGNIFVADDYNQRIREITTDNVIQTIAGNGLFHFSGNGGPATSATLQFPTGVVEDGAGNIYITEQLGSRIRRVTPDGLIGVYAGTGTLGYSGDNGPATSALLGYPTYFAFDSTGTLYFSDAFDFVVRKIDSNGIISTYAGSGQIGFSGDGGPANQATFNAPWGIDFDSAGELIIADSQNHRIRVVFPSGDIPSGLCSSSASCVLTIAGTGTPGYSGDNGSALRAQVNTPLGVRVHNGGIYFADQGNNRIRRIDGTSLTITTVAGNGLQGYSGDGGPATQASLNAPQTIGFDSDGNMYIADTNNSAVRKVTPDGTISTFLGPAKGGIQGDGGPLSSAGVGGPSDIFVDSSGKILIADSFFNRIREVLTTLPTFQVNPSALAFTAQANSAPVDQGLDLTGSISGVPFTVSANSSGWLQVKPASGAMPATLSVTADPTQLTPGSYQGNITIAAPNANPSTQNIPVTLTVTAEGQPSLSVSPASLTFAFVQKSAARSRSLSISNLGGGSLSFAITPATTSGASWLTASPSNATVTAFGATAVNITADPSGLGSGVYSGTVTVASVSPAESVTIPVTMTVSAVPQTIQIPQTGLTYFAVQGGGLGLPQFFNILNTGQGQMIFNATASTRSGGQWLSIFPASGVSDASSPVVPEVRVDANPSGLSAGIYYGSVQVSSAGADNSPQFVSIILDVLPPGSNIGPLIEPAGLLFTGIAGAESPGSQTVLVQSTNSAPLTFHSGRITAGGQNWFTVTPSDGTVTEASPVRIVVQPQTAGLAPGVYHGTLTLSFSDGSTRNVDLVLVLPAAGGSSTTSSQLIAHAQGPCIPTTLVPVFSLIFAGSNAPAGFPGQIAVKVVDDCANPMTSGDVTVSFSNGDAALPLVSLKDGTWVSTWTPQHSASQIAVTADASIPEQKLRGEAQTKIGYQTLGQPPVVGSGAVVNAASFAAQAPLAPGSLISLFGSSLAQTQGSAPALPLPITLGGSAILLAGQSAPLLYASNGQVNALVPYGINVNTAQQLVVSVGSSISVPQSVTLAAAAPGVFTKDGSGSGQGIIVGVDANQVQTLADTNSPVSPGEAVIIYCTGLGEVDPAVPTGAAAPLSPLSHTVNPVSVTIGGVPAQVLFAGLTPGFAGLYQVNALVPAGVTPGSQVSIVITAAGQQSKTVTIAVR